MEDGAQVSLSQHAATSTSIGHNTQRVPTPTSRIAISSSRWVADSRTSREAFLGFEGKSTKTNQDDLETG
jgi:hypothetical protein